MSDSGVGNQKAAFQTCSWCHTFIGKKLPTQKPYLCDKCRWNNAATIPVFLL